MVVRRLLQHRTVTTGTLLGAVSAFLLLPNAFTYAFLTVGTLQGTPFFGQAEPTTSFMYFSLSTITTVGYGDLTAVTPLARLIATAEAVSGQVYLVTFVAMLVGLRAQRWAAGRRDEATPEADVRRVERHPPERAEASRTHESRRSCATRGSRMWRRLRTCRRFQGSLARRRRLDPRETPRGRLADVEARPDRERGEDHRRDGARLDPEVAAGEPRGGVLGRAESEQ